MIDVRQIDLELARSFLKTERGYSEDEISRLMEKTTTELRGSVFLKDEEITVKGPIFEKFSKGINVWLGAFDGNQFVGIHWHAISWHADSDKNFDEHDIFDGMMFAESEEAARALDKKFLDINKNNFVVNYSFCFPDDEWKLDFRKTLGYTSWAAAKYPIKKGYGTLHYLKRLSGTERLSEKELRQKQIERLKKELEDLGG